MAVVLKSLYSTHGLPTLSPQLLPLFIGKVGSGQCSGWGVLSVDRHGDNVWERLQHKQFRQHLLSYGPFS